MPTGTTDEIAAMREVISRGTRGNPLPPRYIAARRALQACLRATDEAFPAFHAAAVAAMADALTVDECASWSRPLALASYGRQADDMTLERLGRRVDARRRQLLAAGQP